MTTIVGLVKFWGKWRRLVDIGRRSWQLLSKLSWPLRWIVAEIKEWHRVSGYRHRLITWNDLPQISQDQVTLRDLGESARNSVSLCDLSQYGKYHLLDKLILPKVWDLQFTGRVALLDDRWSPSISRDVQLTIRKNNQHHLTINQDGMKLNVEVAFPDPTLEIPWPSNAPISFHVPGLSWNVTGKLLEHYPLSPGSQSIDIWIEVFHFDLIAVYQPQ